MATLTAVAAAVRAGWSAASCDPVDRADWSPDNPARGQCGASALVVHDLLGGELLVAEVHRADGSRQGAHTWNRLPDGTEVDLTREQFGPDETVGPPRVVARPPGPPARCRREYARLRRAVLAELGCVVPPLR